MQTGSQPARGEIYNTRSNQPKSNVVHECCTYLAEKLMSKKQRACRLRQGISNI